jgi:ABC-type sugar transport system substrate-binding protein
VIQRRSTRGVGLLAASVVIAGSVAAGIAAASPSKPRDRASAVAASPVIAMFAASEPSSYDAAVVTGAQKEASLLGASFQIFDAGDDPATQASQCEAALSAREYTVFLLDAVNPATVESCATKAIAKGIKLVAVNSPLGPSYAAPPKVRGLVASILSLPQTQYGALARLDVQACAKLNPCNLAFLYGPPGNRFAAAGARYFLKTVEAHRSIHVVLSASWYSNVATAEALIHAVLISTPTVNVITCDGDRGALAIAAMLKQAGRLSRVKVVGAGGSSSAAAAIRSGTLFGTAAVYPESIGELAAKLGVDALNGEAPAKTQYDAGYLEPVGPLIDKQNVAQLAPQWNG